MKKQPVESVVYVIDDDPSVRDSSKSLFGSVGLHVELFESADDSHNRHCGNRSALLKPPACAWSMTAACSAASRSLLSRLEVERLGRQCTISEGLLLAVRLVPNFVVNLAEQ